MIDLHIHTIYSDGEYNEEEIIKKVKKAGIKEFAICDHDTIIGSQKVFNKLKKNNDKLIFHSGVELSCRATKYSTPYNCHIILRDFDYNDKDLNKILKEISTLRMKKIDRMVELVKLAYGIAIKQSDIDEVLKKTTTFGKPHIYQILKKYGDFDREEYYACMDRLNADDLKLSAEEVINLFKDKNVQITLAHPIEVSKEYNLKYIELNDFIKYLKDIGINSLETMHSSHSSYETALLSLMAEEYKLKETSGSDYHGPNVKPNVYLGKCYKIERFSIEN